MTAPEKLHNISIYIIFVIMTIIYARPLFKRFVTFRLFLLKMSIALCQRDYVNFLEQVFERISAVPSQDLIFSSKFNTTCSLSKMMSFV